MRIYTHYSDGQHWATRLPHGSDTYTEIPLYQWWLYSLFSRLEHIANRWLSKVDNRACQEREDRC